MCIKYPQNAILRTHQICYTLMVKKIITLSAMCIPSKKSKLPTLTRADHPPAAYHWMESGYFALPCLAQWLSGPVLGFQCEVIIIL